MLKSLKGSIRNFINNFGYEIVKLEDHIAHARKGNWLQKLDIETIIDIGSNEGQFINLLNKILPNRTIYAFEPIKECYERLLNNTKNINVTAFNTAVGDFNGTSDINVSANFVSSSLLKMETVHNVMYPKSTYVKKETINVGRLDDIMKDKQLKNNILVKVDVQGFEEQVIAGGPQTFEKASAVIIETAYKPMYENQWVFDNIYQFFINKGFVFLGTTDQILMKTTGIPLYCDAVFIKKNLADRVYN